MRNPNRKETMMNARTLILALLAMFGAWASSAQAVLVTDNGAVVFADGFEGVTPTGLDDDPIASIGSWSNNEDPITEVQVITGGSPGAAIRSNYLKVDRAVAIGAFSPIAIGNAVHAEAMVYIPEVADGTFVMRIDDANGDTILNAFPNGTGPGGQNVFGFAPPFQNIDLGIDFTLNKWQRWEMDFTSGQAAGTDWTLTIDGVSVFNPIQNNKIPARITFQAAPAPSNPALFYLDGVVPEPTSVSLLGIGGLMLFRRRSARA